MAKVIFLLKKGPEGQKSRLVNMFFHYGYYRLDSSGNKKYKFVKISTKLNIETKYWIGRPIYRAKETKAFPEFSEFNTRLEFLENTMRKVYRRLVNDGNNMPEPAFIQKEFKKEVGMVKPEDHEGLITFVQQHIEENRHLRAGNTIKKYQGTLNHLENYSKSRGVYLNFESLNLAFYADFHKYLINEKKMTDNSFGKYLATLKGFLHAAEKRGHKISNEFKTSEFKVLKEDVDKIYLNEDELKTIYELDLSNEKHLEGVRDLFILGCHVGLRFSDLCSLTMKDIVQVDNKAFIKIRTKKTSQDVMLPIHPRVQDILKKYGNEFPQGISNQKTNEHLKTIGEKAKINGDVIIEKTKGGVKKRFEHKKYELITTHTARRSFATNAFKMNVPTLSIMKMTGHKTESAFLSYIRISIQENAQKLADHPFFNSKPIK